MKEPISGKVSNGTLGGGAIGLVTLLLVQFIPAWHHGIPVFVSAALPFVLSVAGYFLAGYKAQHKATVTEIEKAVADSQTVLKLVQDAVVPAAAVSPPKASP